MIGFQEVLETIFMDKEKINCLALSAPFNEDAEVFRLKYLHALENSSGEGENIQQTAEALHSIAQSYLMEGNIKDAETSFQKAVKMYKKTSDEFSLAFCLSQYALILRHLSKREQSEEMLVEVIKLSKNLRLKRKDMKNWFLKSYFLNLLEIFKEQAEAKALKRKLEQVFNDL